MYIINGTIYTMDNHNTIYEKGAIHIEDGILQEIGNIDIKPKSGETMIDVKGALILPGLIEAHCHIGITEEKKGTIGDDCNETVNPITPYLRAIDAINPMDAAFMDAVRAGITTVQAGPGSANVVGGQFAIIKTYGRRIDEIIMKSPSAMKVAFGENPKVNYGGQNKSPATRMSIAGLLREELTNAKQYMDNMERAIATGEVFEHDFTKECWLPVLKKEIPIKAHVHRADDIFTAIRIAEEFELTMTLDHCSEGHLIAGEIKVSGYPAIVGPDLASRSKIEVQNLAFKTAGVMAEAGVLLAITTDHPVSLIQSLPLCVGLAVKAGLDMQEGYKAMTANAAKILGVFDRIGSLEVGKDADVAIFDGNPMEIFTQTLYTIINGKIVFQKETKR